MKNSNKKINQNQKQKIKKDSYYEIYKNKENFNKFSNSNQFSKSFQNFTQYLSKNIDNEKSITSKTKKTKDTYREKLENYFLEDSQGKENNNQNIICITENIDNNHKNNFNNLNLIKENAYSITYYKNEQQKENMHQKNDNKEDKINNKINQENNSEQFTSKYTDYNISNNENKKIIEEEINKYYISNISSIENDKNNISLNKLSKQFNNDNKGNLINNIKEEKDLNNNIYPKIIDDDKIKKEFEFEKSIYDVNYINVESKVPNIEELVNYNNKDTDNIINNKYKQIHSKNINFNKDINSSNCYENNKSIKKFYQFLTQINTENNYNNQKSNLRLKIIDKKIRNSKNKYNNFEQEENIKNELTYPGLKRYRHYSTPCLKQFQMKSNNLNLNIMDEKRQNKINIIKKAINNLCNISNNNHNSNSNNKIITYEKNIIKLHKYKNTSKNNICMEILYRNKVDQEDNYYTQNLYNILNGLNSTIKNLPKNENDFYFKIEGNSNKTFTTFPINYFNKNEKDFSQINKINNNNNINFRNKNIYLNYYNNKFKSNFNEYNEKNKKLILAKNVNDMNNKINKLSKRSTNINIQKKTKQSINIFN